MLARFDADEQAAMAEAVERATDAAELFLAEGIESVMNRYNRKADLAEEP